MLDKLKALWAVMQAGESVDNPKMWKAHQVSANMVAAFLFALVQLAKAFGYDFGIDMQTCADIAIGVLAIANVGLTVATTKQIGLPASAVREAEQTVPSAAEVAAEKPATVQAESARDGGRGSVASTIDDDVRARALEWARQHNPTNGLSNDA